ncbi:hypothetical protein PHLCEN_2v1493 [Hermanssonia centrifuga]|uniref:Uncharacterized protein n=1 Tax=Hermanssonia centrifuga TaxID=98765 RepID=A0A2R6RZU4_9APHY|nr:hypothetical protein PHLCEN_2v1493 [Hermanssonia centrifuga]
MTLALPIASFDINDHSKAEHGIQGLVDLVNWEVWKRNEDGDSVRHPLPIDANHLEKTGIFPENHPIIPYLVPAPTDLLDNLSMFSDDLMERLLDPPRLQRI